MLKFLRKSLKILRIVFIVFAAYTVIIGLFLYFTSQNKIQTNVDPIKENRKAIYQTINDPKLNSTKEGRSQIAIYRSVQCGMLGEACTNNPDDGDKNFYNSSFGYLTKAIVFPYANPPASGVYWAYSGLQHAGFVPKSYAAEGIGFAAIQPLSQLWSVFRNVAYLFLVILLVTIGFLIMFRVKINPQTVITLENSLPRIIVALLFVTFSFAIAGFMIDLMYVVIGLGVSVFNNVDGIKSAVEQTKVLGRGNDLWDGVFANGQIWLTGHAIFDILPNVVGKSLRLILAGAGFYFLNHWPWLKKFFAGDIANQVAGVTGEIIPTILQGVLAAVSVPLIFFFAPVILSLFVFLTAILIFFRLFFLLFKSYIMIILLIIFSPLILLFHAIPGQNMFFKWIRNLAGHLLAFPMVVVLLLVSRVIVDLSFTTANGNKFWSPPFLYSANPQAFTTLIGLGILFLIPDLIKAVREAIGIKPSPLKVGAGLFFGGVAGAGGAATSVFGKFGTFSYGLSPVMRFINTEGSLKDKVKASISGQPGIPHS